MKFEDRVISQTILSGNGRHQRIDQLFQFFNGAAIDAQLRRGAVNIHRIFIGIKEQPHAVFNDPCTFRFFLYLHHRTFQKVAYAVDQGIVVDDIGDLSRRDLEFVCYSDFLRFLQIGRSGETDYTVDSPIFRPAVDNGTKLDFIFDGVMNLINKDRQGR